MHQQFSGKQSSSGYVRTVWTENLWNFHQGTQGTQDNFSDELAAWLI